MSIFDFDPLLKRAAEKRAKSSAPKQVPSGGLGNKSYNSVPISLGMGHKSYKASDVSSAAELGRALKPFFDEVARDFRDYVRKVDQFIPQDLVEALRPTMALSLIYVPKDTGALAGSAYLEVAHFRNGHRAEMGYGKGGDPDYTIYVHEVPYKHAEPTSYKFLQRAIDEDWHNIVQRITDNTRLRLGG